MTAVTEAPAVNGAAPPPAPRSTALAVRSETHTLPAKLQYAQELASSGMLPAAFRRQPANVLFAIEYGEMLGLSPVAAMMGIYVIDGKPSAYASLISALVRKAGHKLRVGYDESGRMGWATIVRADDPDFTFRSEWDLERAVTAELCTIRNGEPYAVDSKGQSKPWRKFFPSMTKARAITEVARDACEEALYGLHYTPEELGADVDDEGHVIGGQLVPGSEPAAQQAAGAAQAGDDSWYCRPAAAPEGDRTWAEQAIARTHAEDLTEKEAGDLWREGAAKQAAGEMSKADANRIAEVLRARTDELKAKAAATAEPEIVDAEVVEDAIVPDPTSAPAAGTQDAGPARPGTGEAGGLDPEDEWAAKAESVTSTEDAEAARADLARLVKSGRMTDARALAISAAISSRLASLRDKVAAP